MQSSQDFFKDNGYLKVSNFISDDVQTLLYTYVLNSAQRLANIHENLGQGNYNTTRWGTYEDQQAFGDYSLYGDMMFDTILSSKTEQMKNLTGLNLFPTYSYHRLYTTDSVLDKHIDRKSCEVSTTLCLGYDVSNVNSKMYPDYNWPMWVKTKNNEDVPVHLQPGEMLIYRGCEIEHWRDKFKGNNHAQVFLHYNEVDGQYNNLYDGRKFLGMPHNSVDIEPSLTLNTFDINDYTVEDDNGEYKWIIK
tara:strand:- start:341 stop:1084 length:744 start_codon:yes stop_codon:yes gene_type:complete